MFIGIRLSFLLACKQEIGPFQPGTLPPPWGKTSIYGMPTFRCDQAGRSRGAWVQCGQNDSNGFLNEEWFHSYFCFLLGLRVVRILLVQCCARPSGKWKECPLEVKSLQKGSCRPQFFFSLQQSRMNWRLCCGTLLCIPLWTSKPRCTPRSCCGLIWMKSGVTSFRLASQYR